MLKTVFIVIFLLGGCACYAQPKQIPVINYSDIGLVVQPAADDLLPSPSQRDIEVDSVAPFVCEFVDNVPCFPPVEGTLKDFVATHLRYPAGADVEVSCTVMVRFVTDVKGNISGEKVLRGFRSDFDKEALRMVQQMPCWVPAPYQLGDAVYVLPVKFSPY